MSVECAFGNEYASWIWIMSMNVYIVLYVYCWIIKIQNRRFAISVNAFVEGLEALSAVSSDTTIAEEVPSPVDDQPAVELPEETPMPPLEEEAAEEKEDNIKDAWDLSSEEETEEQTEEHTTGTVWHFDSLRFIIVMCGKRMNYFEHLWTYLKL